MALRPTTLPLSVIAAWPRAAALPTRRAPDYSVRDVRDGRGALVPFRLVVPRRVSRVKHDAECLERGARAEALFAAAAVAAGWRLRNVVGAEDVNKCWHVDLMLAGPAAAATRFLGLEAGTTSSAGTEVELWVEVKALRALRRGGALQNAVFALEMHDRGYLRGRADVIALQVYDAAAAEPATKADAELVALPDDTDKAPAAAFALLDRKKLEAWADDEWVARDAPRAPYAEMASGGRLFRREGHTDELMTYAPLAAAYAAAGCGVVLL